MIKLLLPNQPQVSRAMTKSRAKKLHGLTKATQEKTSQVDLDALNRATTFSEYTELCIQNRLKKQTA